MALRLAATTLVLALAASTAQAHAGHGSEGLAAGFAHPFLGLDHLLAMLAVGLWAGQHQGWRRAVAPAGFLAGMLGGGMMGMAAIDLPAVEAGIGLSVLALGMLAALAQRPAWPVAAVLVAAFGAVHGHAHGTEMAEGATALAHGAGFLAATALLHAAGFLLAVAASRSGAMLLRYLGAGVSFAGVALLAG